ncbi:MAG: TonB-dependent receptor, partial [Calditrichia bacterium]|nr:TonB-dependent receptor [Calditrichia bacterium]
PIGSSTNNGGYFVIPHIPDGQYTLVVEFLGYKPYKQKISIKDGDNIKINIRLKEDLLQTETIIVTADSIRTIEKLYHKSISHVNLSAKQIKHIPQVAEADLLRSLQTLPGVLPLSDYSSALYIRGGTPDQNLYLIDGTDVYNPEHAFGIFSTFNTDAIKQVELSKGGFNAEYGGRLSSVLNVTNLDGNLEQFEGSASISLLSAKTTIQVPINSKGSISGSIRRTYFDKTIAKSVDEIPDYYFYDGNIKGFYNLDDKNKLTVSVFSGLDNLNFIFNKNSSNETGFNLNWGNKTGSLKWTRVFNPRLYSNFWVTTSNFDSEFDLSALKILEKNKIKDLTIKGNLEFAFSNSFRTNFGFE